MRLARLDLTRYGKFTDAQLDFGPARPGRPDLHIVYGPNEAGKSTAFSALLDVLFGIEGQSRFNFLHPYKTMKVGATLELAGGPPRAFGRVKRQQQTLLDAADQPVAEGALVGSLGGLDRTAYRHMFSLDDETLEKGGQTILASKGDLGQLLFSASAGLAELSQTLDALRAEADRFHRGRSHGELRDLKDQLDALKGERDALDTALPAFRKLVESSAASRQRYEEALAERTRLQANASAVARRLQALPLYGRLVALRDRLAPLRDLPHPPAHWRDDLPALQRREVELATQLAGCAAEIANVTAARDALVPDTAVLHRAAPIEALADTRDRYTGAEKDLPERRRSLADQDAKLAHLLRRLDRENEPDPDRLVLGASILGTLRDLIEQRSGIVARRDTAQSQQADAVQALAEADAALAGVGGAGDGSGAGVAALKSVLGALRGSDHAQRRRQAEKARTMLLADIGRAVDLLRPWSGTVDRLASGSPPRAADVARWANAETDDVHENGRLTADVARLTSERARLRAEGEAAARFTGVVSETEAAAARRQREAAWAAHRRDLRLETADAFETALRQDDLITAARLTRSAETARLAQIGQALALAEVDLAAAESHLATRRADQGRRAAEIRQAMDGLGWPAGATLPAAELADWLKQRTACLDLAERVQSEDRAIAEAEADARHADERLVAALAAAGIMPPAPATAAVLLAAAEAAVERESRVAALRDQRADRQAALAKRDREVARSTADATAWQTAWVQACGACWIGADQPVPPVATVRAILDALVELGPLLVQRADLALRIGKMEADQARYRQAVEDIQAELAGADLPGSAPERAVALGHRLAAARTVATRASELDARRDQLETRQTALQQERTTAEAQTAAMTAFFAVSSLADVAIRLDSARTRSELADAARAVEEDIVQLLGTSSLAEAEQILAAADRTALEAERDTFGPRIDDLDGHTRTLFADATRADGALAAVGGDDRVARLAERRRTLLLETEDKARRHLALRIGIAAAEQALRAYRDTHRSTMMQRASDAFHTISRGAYRGLAAQPGDKGEVLVAIGPNGSKNVDDLSKGTRFQLYLALRVAGFHEYCGTREPVPFVADDIMETFDDFRAEEAFRLFADMAAVGQVIYLTHHRHLVDIARSVCPDVRISELPAAA